MRKWKAFVPVLFLVAFVFSTSATVSSQGMSPHPRGERSEKKTEDSHRRFREGKSHRGKKHSAFSIQGMKEALHLDDAQTKKMHKLFRDYRKDVILKNAHLKIARIELEEAISDDKFVLSTIEKKVKEKEAVSTALVMVRVRALATAKGFLSKDQFKKFMGRIAHQMKGRGHGKSSRHGRSGKDPHRRSGKSHGFGGGGFGGTGEYD
jgi:Spy/CpxP family protein refolding chaperone